ncbi:class II glutamine amidotransferase [Cognatishimia sp. 1_MG-2023]|uniref:class II glutamine amidotransferase n=1 Tax=Cognatishimia sp. 1_MG-2023 TaxID=3062642 RepID=UPI0026E35BA9|nr:class II glutamine amidotransferase [Cognatishimia sp. 1_MG-2023]MDO6725308.1 class II glutamine amidotransferase [Cognatishimia sp. 1_MG-2023]
MCRWAAYIGAPIFLEDIITLPGHSLVAQSIEADECKTTTNADGFGVAWYNERPEPGLFRDVYPAWSDPNLRSVAHQVRAGVFLSHVRASTGSCISRNNCHPFAARNWTFMHNGQVGGFEQVRKAADMAIPDDYYGFRRGSTDSEVLFLLALGYGLENDPCGAMEKAVGELVTLSRRTGVTPHMRLSAAISDGTTLYAYRYSSDSIAPSVYYRHSNSRNGWAVVSEPLERNEEGWQSLAPGKMLALTGDSAVVTDFVPDC